MPQGSDQAAEDVEDRMNDATKAFIGDVNEYLAMATQLSARRAVEHLTTGVAKLEARDVRYFTLAPVEQVEMSDEQWTQAIRAARVDLGFAKQEL